MFGSDVFLCYRKYFIGICGIVTKVIIGSAILFIGTGAIFYRHKENILRLQAGTEARFSLLWNKDEEIKRITKGE